MGNASRLACGGVVLALFCCLSAASLADDAVQQKFLNKHCLRCHNEEEQKGRFRLDMLASDFADPQVAQKWSEVVFRINAGEMPPSKEPQPTAAEISEVVDVLTRGIREGAAARMARRGRVEHYRLSRQEFAHTVYDLLGVVYDVESPGAFSEDPRLHGFDRIGALLSVAPSHIESYFDAANAIVELAFPDHEVKRQTSRRDQGEGKRRLLQLGEGWGCADLEQPGRYRIRICASGLPAFTGRAPRLALWHSHHQRSFAGVDLIASETEPETIEFEALLPAGSYSVRNHARSQDHPNGSYKLFRNEVYDADRPVASLRGGATLYQTKIVDEEGRPVMPLLLVDWVEVEGPLTTAVDSAKLQGVLPATEESTEIRACLRRFMERAWRRPVMDSEVERYAALIDVEREAGASFRAAYRTALASVLVSRRFFHLEEGDPAKSRARVDDYELASRLSYFLWSSMPDESLFAAARNGELHDYEVLAEQFDRMLADSKFERFLDSFPKQWLQLHRVGMFQPDPNLYPEYDPWLEESMVMETATYFAEMVGNNLPLREFVDSEWTMLNSRLALHYGMPRPKAVGMARVKVRPKSGRGGLLTHGSILSLTSDGTRHRPVHRGAWLSEVIFAHTPPPPPPNVDPLEPVEADQPKTTIRSQLEAHATDPNCVSCHAKIDPLGLAFENFDAIGRWRDTERVEGGKGSDPRVDASGVLPDGRTFAGPAEFKKLLAEDEMRLAEAFLEQLATYALRRVMTVDDHEQIRRIGASVKEDDYRLRDLMRSFVLSDLFQTR